MDCAFKSMRNTSTFALRLHFGFQLRYQSNSVVHEEILWFLVGDVNISTTKNRNEFAELLFIDTGKLVWDSNIENGIKPHN
jgi:hypothetical protein